VQALRMVRSIPRPLAIAPADASESIEPAARVSLRTMLSLFTAPGMADPAALPTGVALSMIDALCTATLATKPLSFASSSAGLNSRDFLFACSEWLYRVLNSNAAAVRVSCHGRVA
jgi:hypothetical protein